MKLIKNSSIQKNATVAYMIASIFTQGINFFTLPLYTRLLTTSDMGVITTFTSWYSIIYCVATLSLTSGSMSIAMVEYEKQRDKYQSVCLTLSTCSTFIIILIYFIFRDTVNIFDVFSAPIIGIMFLLLLFQPALDSWYVRQRYEYKYKSVLLMSIVISILSMLGPIVCISLAKENGIVALVDIRIIAQYIVTIIASAIIYFFIVKKGKCLFDKHMAQFALRLSLPLIVHTLAKNILDTSDRLMIARMCGSSEAGIYGTVYNISMIALIVWNSINAAVVPYIFNNLKEEKYKSVEKITIKILILFSIVSILVTLIAPEILYILTTKEYYEAVYMMPAIAAGIYFTSVYGIYGNMLLYAKKSAAIMISTCIAAIINIILNYIFISKYGFMAASYTTLISFIILAFLQGKMQIRLYKKEIVSTKYIVIISMLTMMICLLSNFLYAYVWVRYLVVAIMSIIFVGSKKRWSSLIEL